MLQKTHSIAGVLAAEGVVLYFNEPLISWGSAVAVMIGCLAGPLADIDKPGSTMAKVFFPLSYLLKMMGVRHRTLTHSLVFIFGLYVLLSSLPPLYFWSAILAYASHSLIDLLNEQGVALLWPLKFKFRLLPKFLAIDTGSFMESLFRMVLMILFIVITVGAFISQGYIERWGF